MSKKRPNILFLFSDQHNPPRLGCYGDVETQTPHLDALAQAGTLFENCYCQNPLCVPSRRSLSTGKYSKNIGVYENSDVLDDRIHKTLARRLSESGYRTCVIGKQHINGEQHLGFQQRPYGDIYGQGHQPDPYLGHSPRQGQTGLGDTRDGEYIRLAGPTGIPEFQITENIISYPEKVHKNERVEMPVGLMDLYPTFLELAGAAENADGLELDGQSLSPLLTGEGEFPKRQIFSETCWGYVGGAGCMLREGDYKYNCYTESRDELYDLASDPAEVVNLIDSPDHTEIATRMKKAAVDFFDPDSLPERRMKQPRYGASKMHYEFANQYMLGDGYIVDARP